MGIVKNKVTFKAGYDEEEHVWVLTSEYNDECFSSIVPILDFEKGMQDLVLTYMQVHMFKHPKDI